MCINSDSHGLTL